ncbi:hypothetical protein J437_LFUL005163 [Ladona fulva]|uniref:Uncharacterized protein n=1 Tax=Ladona fulva TaxID=123851 RepID=A0A8K0NWL6_LADFU|nr:hypothetical protein J437_LFUL005163 [Ladona fulva]
MCFKLALNVDGVPLFKSSSHQFWVVLCRLSKPAAPGILLKSVIDEINDLVKFGIEIENVVHDILQICDAPARSFIKCTKGHTGSGETPLLTIECLDIVSQFLLDYMDLVCLGVTKRLLSQWTSGPNSVRLERRSRNEISDRLCSMATAIPSDFSRIPRELDNLERWKATEFRTFLLYTGPVAPKNIFSKDLYDHLHEAIRILCLEKMAFPFCGYASELLKSFVEGMTDRYGMDSLVYNIHSLIHLADDVKFFRAPLDKFTSFPYENFLGKMKKIIRCANNPLGQISRRLPEFDFYPGSTEERKEVMLKCSQFGVAKVTVKGTRFSAVRKKTAKNYIVAEFSNNSVECFPQCWMKSSGTEVHSEVRGGKLLKQCTPPALAIPSKSWRGREKWCILDKTRLRSHSEEGF